VNGGKGLRKYRFIYWTLLAVLLVMVSFWVYDIASGRLPYLDVWTRPFVETFKDSALYPFFIESTRLGSKTFIIPFTIVAGAWFWYVYRRPLPAIMFAFGTLGGWLLNELIKAIVQRERPSINAALDALGTSFPSGHAMSAFVCYGLFLSLFMGIVRNKIARRLAQVIIVLLILIIGIGRYLINVHYLTDVVAGYFFGYLFLLIWLGLYQYLRKRSQA